MIKKYSYPFFLGCLILMYSLQPTECCAQLESPYFNLKPTNTPQLLGPDIISTALTEYNGTFSPDGKEFFYTSESGNKGHIVYMKMNDQNQWSPPEIAEFSGQYSEYDPLFSPDGNRLYFSSERPVDSSDEIGNTNIWYVERTKKGWSVPQHVPLSGNGDYFSSITRDGDIYFNIWNTGKILKATQTESGYTTEELPTIINSRSDVGDPFISPDEDYMIYRAFYNEGYGRGDLYISFNIDGEWTTPENLGDKINTKAHEICPFVTADGNFFIFASNRMEENGSNESLEDLKTQHNSSNNGNSNIYYMSADFIQQMRAKH